MKIESDIPHRTTSYQRLVEKIKRNPSERVDTKDWPRPNTPKEVIQHAIKGATSKIIKIDFKRDTVFSNNSIRSICIGLWCKSNCQFLFIFDTYSEGKVNAAASKKKPSLCINFSKLKKFK